MRVRMKNWLRAFRISKTILPDVWILYEAQNKGRNKPLRHFPTLVKQSIYFTISIWKARLKQKLFTSLRNLHAIFPNFQFITSISGLQK